MKTITSIRSKRLGDVGFDGMSPSNINTKLTTMFMFSHDLYYDAQECLWTEEEDQMIFDYISRLEKRTQFIILNCLVSAPWIDELMVTNWPNQKDIFKPFENTSFFINLKKLFELHRKNISAIQSNACTNEEFMSWHDICNLYVCWEKCNFPEGKQREVAPSV